MHNPGEETVVCPYEKAHVLLKSRMQFHLAKCRVNYPHLEKATCPFNSTHIVNKVELENHMETCCDRSVVDNFVYRISDPAPSGLLPVQTFRICSNDDESWDDPPTDGPSVLDQVAELAKTRDVLIPKIGAPKSERKTHRKNERLRHAQLRNSEYGVNSKQGAPAPALPGTASETAQAPPRAQEPKKVDIAPPPHVPEPKFAHPQSSGSQNTAPPSNPWSGGRPAPQVSNPLDFPTLGSKGSRRDNDIGLQDQMNNMTLLDSDRNERPNVWGKPAPRQQDACISVPAGGLGGGGNRSHSNPWGRSNQQQRQRPVEPVQPEEARPTPPEPRQLGPMPSITPDDFPCLMMGRGRGIRKIRN